MPLKILVTSTLIQFRSQFHIFRYLLQDSISVLKSISQISTRERELVEKHIFHRGEKERKERRKGGREEREREKENEEIYFKKLLLQVWGLAGQVWSLRSVCQDDRPETLQQELTLAVPRQNFFFLRETPIFSIKIFKLIG